MKKKIRRDFPYLFGIEDDEEEGEYTTDSLIRDAIKAANKELREELKEHTEFLVNSSRLVFSTISNFELSTNLYKNRFDNLIVDEASMMAMPSLLALGHNISKRLILVGDFQQLSPISIVKDEMLTESVFEMSGVNIRNTGHPALYQLLSQRRSNEKKPNKIGRLYSGENGERLLNVAVSRARHKLIIVCDPEYIKNIPGNTMTPNSQSLFNKLSKYSN